MGDEKCSLSKTVQAVLSVLMRTCTFFISPHFQTTCKNRTFSRKWCRVSFFTVKYGRRWSHGGAGVAQAPPRQSALILSILVTSWPITLWLLHTDVAKAINSRELKLNKRKLKPTQDTTARSRPCQSVRCAFSFQVRATLPVWSRAEEALKPKSQDNFHLLQLQHPWSWKAECIKCICCISLVWLVRVRLTKLYSLPPTHNYYYPERLRKVN